MSLLNYTTKIPSVKTAHEITQMLVKAGARQIMSEYDDDGNVSALSFSLETPNGLRGFTLPVDHEPVEAILANDPQARSRLGTNPAVHARNVAWRITKDWVEAQLALIETEMVTFEQVMLPYMRTVDGGTFYEVYLQGNGTKALGA